MVVAAIATSTLYASASDEVTVTPLITSAGQFSSNASDETEGTNFNNLIDNDVATFWQSNWHVGNTSITSAHYLQVNLSKTIANEFIYAYTQRREYANAQNPLRLRVEGSLNGSAWTYITTATLGNDAPTEKAVSNPIYINGSYNQLRFIIQQTSGNEQCNGYLHWGMSEFQLFEPSGYSTKFSQYSFEHTHGPLLERNRQSQKDIFKNWCDFSGWDSNGNWTRDTDKLAADGISIPSYAYFTSATDSRIKTGNRQPTHIQEHTVYAIPGDIVLLYPFSDFNKTSSYYQNFVRWYDYETDGASKYIDCVAYPERVNKTSYGLLGGRYVSTSNTHSYDFEVNTPADLVELARLVNDEHKTDLRVKQNSDIDMSGVSFTPIGIYDNYPFRGTYNGNGHVIKNLTIDLPDWDFVGMFGRLGRKGEVKNVILQNCNIKGHSYVGSIAGGYNDPTQTDHWGYIQSCAVFGTVTASGVNAGGLIGCAAYGSNPTFYITANLVGCNVSGGSQSAQLSGWTGAYGIIDCCYCTGTVTGNDSGIYFARHSGSTFRDCYTTYTQPDFGLVPADRNSTDFCSKLNATYPDDNRWETNSTWGMCMPRVWWSSTEDEGQSIKFGAVASFYCPENEDFDDKYIACDISQSYNEYYNVDRATNTLYEPIIAGRHIFHIKNGKTFADEFSGSPENNKKYVKEHKRYITARTNAPFQVRLDFPMPLEKDGKTGKSGLYYKAADGSYKSVYGYEIRSYNVTNRTEIPVANFMGYTGEFAGYGDRSINGVEAPCGDAGTTFARSITATADKAQKGKFLVRLYGKDADGNVINIAGTSEELVIAEYEIEFVDSEKASFIPDTEYNNNEAFKYHRADYLESQYGAPVAKIDYDEYRLLENADGTDNDYIANEKYNEYTTSPENSKIFKWPIPWQQNSYMFGYSDRFDYDMYMIANHSVATPYRILAEKFPASENFGKQAGLYDRLFYETKGEQQGYFYYINAASDPGVSANLDIDDLCTGSTLFVSAWVAEFSDAPEVANLILNFKAVLKNGEERTINSFVTGYIDDNAAVRPNLGRWIHIYYSFIPNLAELGITSDDIASYRLSLENNCISSNGADYAIDDIRVWVSKPQVSASQTSPLCDCNTTVDIKIESPFTMLLSTLGLSEAQTAEQGKTINCYYTVLDKDEYIKVMKSGTGKSVEAFNKAVLHYEYNPGKGTDQTFGKVTFNTFYANNPDFDQSTIDQTKASVETIDGERMIVISAFPTDNALVAGKEYILALYTEEDNGADATPGAYEFDIAGECTKVCTYRVRSSETIKINGVVQPDQNNITCCKNQSPVVQIDLWGKKTDGSGDIVEVEKNAHMDWYDGRLEDFYAEKNDSDISLCDAIFYFREEYPEATTAKMEAKGNYSEECRNYLIEMTSVRTIDGKEVAPKVLLYQSSYVFAPAEVPDGEDNAYSYATAIPINKEYPGKKVCTSPAEIRLNVLNNSPEMSHGFRDGITYPDWMDDVPLRIGLNQLKSVSTNKSSASTSSVVLNIPIRRVLPVTEGITSLTVSDDPYVYLAETNDPTYKNLQYTADDNSESGLAPIGLVRNIVASKDGSANILRVVFHNDFRFSEGYYYRMKFGFVENTAGTGVSNDNVCDGELVFTLKVVPEYQKWTGAKNTNWNNDDNWSRVTSTELYRESDENDEFTTDGTNDNAFCYAPLDFTKVVMPAGKTYPNMYAPATATINVSVDGTTSTYNWANNPSQSADGTSPAGNATEHVQYDMVANSVSNGIGCRPWYANTCDQINFTPNSEILNQQHLNYNRAWVEMEMAPTRWYTLSSPLQNTPAGDMYLPTNGAQQLTELFRPITFNYGTNNRFAPAVYQRAWNKSSATVVELSGSSKNVAVRSTWSNVYNDVNELYTAANGFSIKTDVSRATNPGASVLFRLPKDDTSYSYYNQDGNQVGNQTAIDRTNSYRLNAAKGSVTINAAAASKYFLAGNPFMAHIDMKKFLEANSSVINAKYWVMTSDGQTTAIMDPTTGGFVGTLEAAASLPPMQGFFVEAKNPATSITLNYDESMITVEPYDATKGNLLRKPEAPTADNGTRAIDDVDALRITAIRNNEEQTQSLLRINPAATAEYDESEDVAMLDDSNFDNIARVYTIAGNIATSINTLPDFEGTEIGVIANDNEQTVLRFNGIGSMGIMLYDAETDEYTKITEDMEYTVNGNVSNRLFLTTGTTSGAVAGLRITVKGRNVTVVDANGCNQLSANVFDTLGKLIKTETVDANTITFTLSEGIYIVDAMSDNGKVHKKVIIK